MNRKFSTELVQIKTTDSLFLPGLLYEPTKKSKKAAIFLHGNGSSSVFYDTETNIYGEALTKEKIAYLALNSRGANYIKSFQKIRNGKKIRVLYGMAYEKIKECILDIDAAIAFLKKRGHDTFYLIGISTGANKICVYNYYKPNNPVAKYILLSGGDDSGLYYTEWGKKKFFEMLGTAKKKIRAGQGRELIVGTDKKSKFISYQSLYDTINPDGDYNCFPFNEVFKKLKLSKKKLFRHFKSINKPTLVVYGDSDEYCYGRVPEIVEILKCECSHPQIFKFVTIKNADHSFGGREKLLIEKIIKWLKV